MVKRRSKNILKSKNIRNKRSKIRRNRKRTNLKRKTKKYRRKISGGGKTISEIYDDFLKYDKLTKAGYLETSKRSFKSSVLGNKIPDDIMEHIFEDILKNTKKYPHPGDEVMTSYFNRDDSSTNKTAKLYEIFGFKSVEEFDENRERLRKEYETEFGKYIPPVDVSREVVYDYGRLNQTTEKPTLLQYRHGYTPHPVFSTRNEEGEKNNPRTVYKTIPSLRGFHYQNEELKTQRDLTSTNPSLERLYKDRREMDRQAKEKTDQMTEKSAKKMMKYYQGGGK